MTMVVRFWRHRLIDSKTRTREVASSADVASSEGDQLCCRCRKISLPRIKMVGSLILARAIASLCL